MVSDASSTARPLISFTHHVSLQSPPWPNTSRHDEILAADYRRHPGLILALDNYHNDVNSKTNGDKKVESKPTDGNANADSKLVIRSPNPTPRFGTRIQTRKT